MYYFERHLKLTMSNTTLDLVSGSIGGIAGTIVGHPFDTVKGHYLIFRKIENNC